MSKIDIRDILISIMFLAIITMASAVTYCYFKVETLSKGIDSAIASVMAGG